MAYRTDLAVELLENLRGRDELSGVSEREYEREGLHIHEAEVTTERAARLLGKPCGRYLTLSLEALSRREEEAFPRSVRVLAALIETLLPPLDSAAPVLIAGLGSRSITPDAVGPRSADHVIATRHLISRSPEFFASWRPVSVLAPGVLGQTGVETGEIVRGVLDHVRPRAVIVIDALAAGRLSRLVRTVQLADTGIVPGSGVNNARAALDRQTLGVPVLSAYPRSRTAARSPMRSRSSSTAHSARRSTTCPSRSSSPHATSTARSRIPPGSSATRSTWPSSIFPSRRSTCISADIPPLRAA